jgi:hypothetical protein
VWCDVTDNQEGVRVRDGSGPEVGVGTVADHEAQWTGVQLIWPIISTPPQARRSLLAVNLEKYEGVVPLGYPFLTGLSRIATAAAEDRILIGSS